MNQLGHILILGTGVTGLATARYCSDLLDTGRVSSVTLADSRPLDAFPASTQALSEKGVSLLDVSNGLCGAWDTCVVSPGISPFSKLYRSAENVSTLVVSEPELAYMESPHDWIVVTGTNGKTTTTALIAHLISSSGASARAVGNIGVPCIEAVADRVAGEVLVAELSSYQLYATRTLRPRVAVLLNITPDHIDWHGSMEHYVESKRRVFANMGEGDTVVFDASDTGARSAVCGEGLVGVRLVAVSDASFPDHAISDDGVLTVSLGSYSIELLPSEDLHIKGEHNKVNALAAAAAALAWGVEAHDVADGLSTFEPLAHRIEPVGNVEGVEFFNDSKATNTDAVLKALTAFGERPLIVLLGGYDKGTDLSELAHAVSARCKSVVLFGAAAPRFASVIDDGSVACEQVVTLREAVRAAFLSAAPGDAILLSPACASFDEFDSYAHRGDSFRACVAELGGA